MNGEIHRPKGLLVNIWDFQFSLDTLVGCLSVDPDGEGIAPLILYVGTRWDQRSDSGRGRFNSYETFPVHIVSDKLGVDVVEKTNFIPFSGVETLS
jgi:hypothetical protein